MNILLAPVRILWKLWFGLNFVLSMLVLYPVFLVLLSREKWFPVAFMLMKVWARYLMAVIGIIYLVKYEDVPDPNTPYIICPNHCSYIDIILLYCIFPNYSIFMGKQELSKAPLFNIFFKKMNILVDRKSRISAHRAFIRAGKELTRKHSVVIFPEGTIPSNPPKMKVFKNGAFRLAIEKQVPILPVTFLNNWKFLGTGAFFKSAGRPGIARIIVHHPIPTTGMNEESLVFLRTKVYNTIQLELDKYLGKDEN